MQKSFSLVSVILFKLLSVKYGNVSGYFWHTQDFECSERGYKMRIVQMHKVSFNDFFFSALATLHFLFFAKTLR